MNRLEWLQSAVDELFSALMRASPEQREAIVSAAWRIDQALREDPWIHGESRPTGRRIYFDAPLGVLYRIERVTNTVLITSAWTFESPRP